MYGHRDYPNSTTADKSTDVAHAPPETSRETETYPTIDSLAEQRRAQARSQAQSAPSSSASVAAPEAAGAAPGGPDDLEEEASQQGAFNEETGEINWECPCLGGMAHGPCGEQFRTAFSCFVFSKEEPKGVDCIEHFKGMQDCFRDHPDIYGAELDDVDADEMPPAEGEAVPATPRDAAAASPHEGGEKVSKGYGNTGPEAQARTERAVAAGEQVKQDHGIQESMNESEAAVPKNWHDTTDANTAK